MDNSVHLRSMSDTRQKEPKRIRLLPNDNENLDDLDEVKISPSVRNENNTQDSIDGLNFVIQTN
jgi:hypothetical protein